MTQIFNANCYFVQEKYNPRLRATIPPSWVVEFDSALIGTNVPPMFFGNTRKEAIQNTIDCLKSFGLTGRLILN